MDQGKHQLAIKVLEVMEEQNEALELVFGLMSNLAHSGYDLNKLVTEDSLLVNYTAKNPLPTTIPTDTPPAVEIKEDNEEHEDYSLPDFQKQIPKVVSEALQLPPEEQMVLLTFGWVNRDLSTAFVIKHSRRVSNIFGLYSDPRWVETYSNGKVKMRAKIASVICKFKGMNLVEPSYKSGHNVFYALTDLGKRFATDIAAANDFSFDKSF